MKKRFVIAYVGLGLALAGMAANTIEILTWGIGMLRPGIWAICILIGMVSLLGVFHHLALYTWTKLKES